MQSPETADATRTRWTWGRGFSALTADALLIVWSIVVLVVARATMMVVLRRHIGAHATTWSVVSALLNGLRFDVRIATIVALPSIVASWVAFRRDAARFRQQLRLQIATWFVAATVVLVTIDVAYFEEFGNQFDHFLFGLVFDDRKAIFGTIWRGYPVLRIAAGTIVVALFAAAIARRLFRRSVERRWPLDHAPAWMNGAALAFAFIAIVCGVRGSVGRRPAQIKVAAVTGDELLDKVVANPFEMLASAATDYLQLRRGSSGLQRFLHHGAITDAAQRYFRTNADVTNLDEADTRRAPGASRPPRHVVLIVMESYSAWAMEPAYRDFHLADSMLALSDSGLSVPRFVSAGPGTMASLGTLMTGLPDSGLAMSYETSAMQPYPTSIAAIFHQLGFRTRFFYGGYLSWQRIGQLAHAQGFDEVHGGAEIGNWLEGKEWGVDDERLFDYAHRSIRDDVPSFDLILSVSNHPPFDVDLAALGQQIDRIPPHLVSRVDDSVDLNVLGHFRYADRCLGRFVRSTEASLTRPLFAITGDHYGRRFPNAHPSLYERLGVPFVLYGPQVLSGITMDPRAVGAHLDVIPTLVDLAAPSGFAYHALGRNLLQPSAEQIALGNSSALTSSGAVEFDDRNAVIEGPIQAADVRALRQRYDDLHALGWWRARVGSVLPIPPRVFDCRSNGVVRRASANDPLTRRTRGPLYAGHRGMGGDEGTVAPELTLSALRAAIAYGLDFVEVDPRPTSDGVLVVMHDSTVDRTTYGHGKVCDLTFAQVRALRIRWERYPGDFTCESVPTFEEVLRTCRGRIPVLVDADKTDRVGLIVDAIRKVDAHEWAIFDSRDVSKIRQALALDPQLKVMIRPKRVEDITSACREIGRKPVIMQLGKDQLREGTSVAHAYGAKVLTNVFDEDSTIDETGDVGAYRQLIAAGSDILQSDRPEILRKLGLPREAQRNAGAQKHGMVVVVTHADRK